MSGAAEHSCPRCSGSLLYRGDTCPCEYAAARKLPAPAPRAMHWTEAMSQLRRRYLDPSRLPK